MILDSALNIARKGALAYIGAVALTGDEVARMVNRLAARGESVEATARARLRRTIRSAREGVAEGREQIDEARMSVMNGRDRLLDALNIPTQMSIEELNAQVARLAAEVDELRGALHRRQAEATAGPLPGYDKLNAEAVIERLAALNEPTLLALRAYEQEHANRVTVLRAIERTLIGLQAARGALAEPAGRTTVAPLPRYDELRAEEVIERLAELNEAELLHVRTYEQEHQARVTVLRAVEERLGIERAE